MRVIQSDRSIMCTERGKVELDFVKFLSLVQSLVIDAMISQKNMRGPGCSRWQKGLKLQNSDLDWKLLEMLRSILL